jgi:DNA-binding NarL/FixJ family response regulator
VTATTGPIRVVLADDQAMVRSGLALILGAEHDIEVDAACADGEAAVAATRRYQPHVVLLDVRMPVMDGPEATRRILALPKAPPVIALTTFDDDEVLWSALHAGAAGFLLKDSPAETLADAVRAVAGGGAWIDARVLPRVLAHARTARGDVRSAARLLGALTPREAAVLALMCHGSSNAEIAQDLRLAERTVKSHVSAILLKLGARDRVSAVVTAFEAGVPQR